MSLGNIFQHSSSVRELHRELSPSHSRPEDSVLLEKKRQNPDFSARSIHAPTSLEGIARSEHASAGHLYSNEDQASLSLDVSHRCICISREHAGMLGIHYQLAFPSSMPGVVLTEHPGRKQILLKLAAFTHKSQGLKTGVDDRPAQPSRGAL